MVAHNALQREVLREAEMLGVLEYVYCSQVKVVYIRSGAQNPPEKSAKPAPVPLSSMSAGGEGQTSRGFSKFRRCGNISSLKTRRETKSLRHSFVDNFLQILGASLPYNTTHEGQRSGQRSIGDISKDPVEMASHD